MDYKNGKWAQELIYSQQPDGLWGKFHALSVPVNGRPLHTEQALRRLKILGFTKDDEVIARPLSFMEDCLLGKRQMPDHREKTHNWDVFTELMLSTWLREFDPQNPVAAKTARKWASIIGETFRSGTYSREDYENAYIRVMGIQPCGARFVDFVSFYVISLLRGEIPEGSGWERAYFDYVFRYPMGIYYICQKPVSLIPAKPDSIETSRWLGGIEILCGYPNAYCKRLLAPAAEWLVSQKRPDGLWDFGGKLRDGVYFPLSDSWRNIKDRTADQTFRISKIIHEISM